MHLDRVPLRRYGWAFQLAWVFCIFYTESVSGYIGGFTFDENSLPVTLLLAGLPLFSSLITLFIVVVCEGRLKAPTSHRTLFVIAPLLTAIGTPLMFIEMSTSGMTLAIFAAGSTLTGIGSGLLWVMWGCYYARIDRASIERYAPLSAIAAVALTLLVSSTTGWISVALVTLFPLLAGSSLYLSWNEQPADGNVSTTERWADYEQDELAQAHRDAANSPIKALRVMGRAGLGILTACTVVCILGSFIDDASLTTGDFQIVLLASAVLIGFVTMFSTRKARRINIPFLFRWMCPLLVFGISCLVWFPGFVGGYLGYMVAIASRFAFCLITQMYFAYFAASGKVTPTQSYGLGWIFVHLGDFIGVLFIVLVLPMIDTATELPALCLVLVLLLVVVTMFVAEDSKRFDIGHVSDGQCDAADESGATDEPSATDEPKMSIEQAFDDRLRSLDIYGQLTPREREVFILLAHGRSVPYIRDALVISKETASTHVKHIYTKLGIHSRQELIDLVDESDDEKGR